ncbi:nitroreductase [Brevundimonas sp. SORGH_AS_0993]|uniref:nitroreductase family protein n=1 Tax=Brevundimonas sp. SORGH_AS_0993 TaxID=3041794 RepID=UPI00277F3066|nr:nitroreductase [Brevundimonas sp. SORGH_AS_0993]MDQ1153768.1 nitroreductase [Brevundimonas sp. SORGH_AS_0993]
MTDLTDALPLPVPSPEFLERLATRRSAPAQALTAPGPSEAELDQILQLGARTPDHGKLFPWRFVVLGPQTRAQIAEKLAVLAELRDKPAKNQAVLAKLTAAPVTLLVVSAPVPASKPVWEQELSAGAVCMNLEHAAGGFGYSASWITDWYSYDPHAAALFGVQEGERIAGFIHIGTLAEPPLERPRPEMSAKVTRLP